MKQWKRRDVLKATVAGSSFSALGGSLWARAQGSDMATLNLAINPATLAEILLFDMAR